MQPARWLPEALGVNLSQREVDFVVPRLDADLPLAIDPFLLYKSRREDLKEAHGRLVAMFNKAIEVFRQGDLERAKDLVTFPEVAEIRLGYAEESIVGTGIGEVLSGLVIDVLKASPALVERGLKHIEELQLFSVGIGPDRISDATAGVLKPFLVEYTNRQAALWNIPTEPGQPLPHMWDEQDQEWRDAYVTLPVDPATGIPILLVPRWIVRALPWINYVDYRSTELTRFLRVRTASRRQPLKEDAVAVTRREVTLVDQYVGRKEREASSAQPTPPPLLATSPFPAGDDLLVGLAGLSAGRDDAYNYQRLVLELLNTLLEPELVDGEAQVRTATGTEIRDLVYSNNSDLPFLRFLMNECKNALVVFECKNVVTLDADDVNQLANYLGDAMGYCGFLVTRNQPGEAVLKKCRATYSKGSPHRVILVVTDADFSRMVEIKRIGSNHPVSHLHRKYRELVQSIE
jgi:hypothetical protein